MTSRLASLDALTPADLVVACNACSVPEDVLVAATVVRDATERTSPRRRAVLVFPESLATNVDAALDGLTPDPDVQFLPHRLNPLGRMPFVPGDDQALFHPLATIAERAGAHALVMVGGMIDGVTADTIERLASPVLDQAIDLVLPSYPRHALDGLINSAIVYPLTRALYGQRVGGQLGLDFGFSRRLLHALGEKRAASAQGRSIWLLAEAVARGMHVAQAHVSAWRPPAEPATDVSTALAEVLGSLFDDMEHHASIWQRTRGSQAVLVVGEEAGAPDEPRDLDATPMVESFQLGFRNLQDVWGRLLPPATLVELNRLTRLAPDQFRMPDKLWARVICDFAIGHRLRTIRRDHLLRALTPVYLGWVASFVAETGQASRFAARTRIERLCLAYEAEKPYLLARWRWPDRFNP